MRFFLEEAGCDPNCSNCQMGMSLVIGGAAREAGCA